MGGLDFSVFTFAVCGGSFRSFRSLALFLDFLVLLQKSLTRMENGATVYKEGKKGNECDDDEDEGGGSERDGGREKERMRMRNEDDEKRVKDER